MKKIFEDYFTELQADMVDICLQNVQDQGDKVYIYCSCENKVNSVAYFYKINGKMVQRHKVNEELPNISVAPEKMFKVLDILQEDLRKIEELCEEYKMQMPTEMKLIYEIPTKKFDAHYEYDLMYTNHPTRTTIDIENEWFDELKAQEEIK